jgi:hypothetical protein
MKSYQLRICYSKKLLILIIFSIFFSSIIPNRVLAYGSHLYSVAHVNLVMSDGKQKNGYIQIYYGYINGKIELESLAAVDLVEVFADHVEKIIFAENYYNFPGIGSMVATEEIDTLLLGDLKKAIFISWVPDFGGAFEIVNIPKKSIKKIQNKGQIEIRSVTHGLTDYVFVNLNPNISEEDLNLIVKYAGYINNDLFYLFPSDRSKNYDDVSYVKRIEKRMQKKSKKLTNQIEYFLETSEKGEMVDIVNFVISEYRRRIALNDAVLSLIEDEDEKEILQFVKEEVKDKDLQNSMNSVIAGFHDKNESVAAVLSELSSLLNELMYSSYHAYASDYGSILSENDVILITVKWD